MSRGQSARTSRAHKTALRTLQKADQSLGDTTGARKRGTTTEPSNGGVWQQASRRSTCTGGYDELHCQTQISYVLPQLQAGTGG